MAKPKGKSQVTITILYGLPGSGKTYHATKHESNIKSVDFDKIVQKHGPNKSAILETLNKEVDQNIYRLSKYQTSRAVIVDGLITTNQQLRDVIDSLTAYLTKYDVIFRLVYWNEDRESCLYNDDGRREVSSSVSIKNLPYEKPDFKSFPELSQKRVQSMKVVRKSPAIAWVSEVLKTLKIEEYEVEQILDSMTLKSSNWSLGGTWGGWDGTSGSVSADTPLDFSFFDKVLEVICPEISFLKYKMLVGACCKIVQSRERDYYGGSTIEAHHECDVQDLYDALNEMGLLKK